MKKAFTALMTAAAIMTVAPAAFAKDANPIFGKAALKVTTTDQNKATFGKGAYADYYGYYGYLYSYYAYYYANYGYTYQDAGSYYSAYTYSSTATTYLYNAYYYQYYNY